MDTSPAEKIAAARTLLEDDRNAEAKELLEGARGPVAGTALEGEVVFLLGRAESQAGNPADAEVLFGTYLSRWPDGPHAPDALFERATCFIRVAERTRIGFFTLTKVVPFDRDITPLVQAETLFTEFKERYPANPRAGEASSQIASLREKRGLHELDIAEFYLGHGNPGAALARAREVAAGEYPAGVRETAAGLAARARDQIPPGAAGVEGTGDGR